MSGIDIHSNTVLQETGKKDCSEEEWKQKLTAVQFKVLRKKATEPRRTTVAIGGFDDHFEKGTYLCAGCQTPLYDSTMKFDCGCGWPGFWTNIKEAVCEKPDKDGQRIEITCSACRGHLGHIFRNEGMNNPPPNERHCVNSVSLAFVPAANKNNIVNCTYTGPLILPFD
jgi:peptide-methionine (R)-S-oxide reductase